MLAERFKKLTHSLLIAVSLYLAFSKLNLWFLSLPALFFLTRLRNFKFWFFTGFCFFFLSLFWVRIAMIDYGGVSLPIAYGLVLSLSLFMTLYQFGLSYLLWKVFRFNFFLLPALWTLVEILRSSFPYGGFPWLLIGELLVDFPLIKYYLTAGGVYLGSLILWYVSLTPLLLRKRKYAFLLITVFLIPLPFFKMHERGINSKDLRIAIVQPNVSEEVKLSEEKFYEYLPVYWKLLDEIIKHKPDIIFLPESAFPFTANELYTKGKKLIKYSERAVIVTGLIDIRYSGDEPEPYNSVFVLHKGVIIDFYDKIKLLPFGEYVPFPFGFIKDIFGAIAGIDYIPGNEPRCVTVNDLKIATPICFEISYFNLIRKMSSCADLIAVFTNDGWFRDSDGSFQHLRQARVRAIENGKFLLWINNTGPSAVISPAGEILKSIPYGKTSYLIYSFHR